MKNITAEQLNNVPELEGNIIRVPRALYSARKRDNLPLTAILSGGLVFSYSRSAADGTERFCTRTYSAFSNATGRSKSAISRAIGALKVGGYIEKIEQSKYKYIGEGGQFDRVEEWMLTSVHNIEGETPRRFTNAEVIIFAYFYSRKNKNGEVECTNSKIAAALNLDTKTVREAIKTLMHAGYISRPHKDKGVNRFKKSVWHLNQSLLNRCRKSAKKKPFKGSQTEKAAIIIHKTQEQADAERREASAAFEKFNATRRQIAESLAELNERKANTDKEFSGAQSDLNKLAKAIAFAEVRNEKNLPELLRRQAETKLQRANALKRLRLTEQDLMPQYECAECKDTGYTSDGRLCKACWRRFKDMQER